ncbi:Ff.00g052640.m01.CDS01 [Fusarium sp. VM40]|nr:Ff.00g052640.m01.CDS01 [Fusarium sp. VM40]
MSSIESRVSKQGEAPLQNDNEDAEQMATFAEGKVADAVKETSTRDKPRKDDIQIEDFSSDLERKKAEQAEARENIKAQRQAGVNVDGSLGQGRLSNEDNGSV